MQSHKEIKASFLYLVGNLSTKAIAFLTIPVFTRLLTTSEYGIVNTYTSWVQIVTVVMTLSLYNSFRKAYVDHREDFESYCASSIRLGGLFFIVSTALASLILYMVPGSGNRQWMVYCCLVQAYGVFCVASMSTKYMLQFRYMKRTLYMALPNIACALLALILLLTHDKDREFWRIIAYVAVYAVFTAMSLWSTRKEKTNRAYWKYAVTYSAPLVFHGLSLVVLSSSDRIMITNIAGSSESGIYSLVYNLGLVASAVITSLEGIWLPWFIRRYNEKEIEKINEKAVYMIENVTVVVIGVMLVAPEVLQVMASEQYWPGKPVIFPVVAASYIMFLYDLAVNVEYQEKATKMIVLNTTAAAVINIILNFILIPVFGAVAAAYTTVTAYIFSMVLHYYCAGKFCRNIFPLKRYVPYYAVVAVCTVISEFTYDIRFAPFRWAAALLLAAAYLYAMFRKKRFIAMQVRL